MKKLCARLKVFPLPFICIHILCVYFYLKINKYYGCGNNGRGGNRTTSLSSHDDEQPPQTVKFIKRPSNNGDDDDGDGDCGCDAYSFQQQNGCTNTCAEDRTHAHTHMHTHILSHTHTHLLGPLVTCGICCTLNSLAEQAMQKILKLW